MSAYGTAALPKGDGGGFPLPPPPDGKPPVRLPFDVPQSVEPETPQGPEASLMRLLQSLGKV